MRCIGNVRRGVREGETGCECECLGERLVGGMEAGAGLVGLAVREIKQHQVKKAELEHKEGERASGVDSPKYLLINLHLSALTFSRTLYDRMFLLGNHQHRTSHVVNRDGAGVDCEAHRCVGVFVARAICAERT